VSLAIHLHPDVRRYAVPSEFDMIRTYALS